jgi:hypothetical protein
MFSIEVGVSSSSAVFPYSMKLKQPPSGDGTARGYTFAREYTTKLEESSAVFNVTRFSAEIHFHMNYYINKRNVQFWASENPWFAFASTLHPRRVLV